MTLSEIIKQGYPYFISPTTSVSAGIVKIQIDHNETVTFVSGITGESLALNKNTLIKTDLIGLKTFNNSVKFKDLIKLVFESEFNKDFKEEILEK